MSNLLIIAVVLLVISILFFSKPFLFPTPKTALTENGIQTLRNDEEVFSMTWNEIAFVRQSSLDGSLIFSNESNSKKMTVYLPIKSWSEIFEKLHGNKKLPEFPVVFKSSKWLLLSLAGMVDLILMCFFIPLLKGSEFPHFHYLSFSLLAPVIFLILFIPIFFLMSFVTTLSLTVERDQVKLGSSLKPIALNESLIDNIFLCQKTAPRGGNYLSLVLTTTHGKKYELSTLGSLFQMYVVLKKTFPSKTSNQLS